MTVRDVAEINILVGEAFQHMRRALAVCGEAGVAVKDIDLVGSHGQTVYHHSTVLGSLRTTLQLGDGDVIAERLGLPVISDFRARDIAAGGEGRPASRLVRRYGVLYGRTARH